MFGLRRFLLVSLALVFCLAAQARAESNSLVPPLDPKVKAEMKVLQDKIKTDRTYLKGERERLKPVVERLKANNAKLRALRDKVKAQRDAKRASQPADHSSAGLDDDPLDEVLPTP